MKMLKMLALLLAVMLCMSTVLGAVAETAEVTEAAETTAIAADEVMATVNGVPVTMADVQSYVNYLNDYYGQDYDVTDPEIAGAIRGMALGAAVQLAVMKGKAAELGYDKLSDEELAALTAENDAQWAEMIDFYAAYYGGGEGATEEENAMAQTQALALLEGAGYTKESMLQSSLDSVWYDKLYADMVQGAEVNDADIEAAFAQTVALDQSMYEGNIMMYEYYTQYMGYESTYTPAGYRGIRHILLNVDDALMEAYNDLTARLEEQIEAVEAGTEEAEAAEETAPVTQADVDAAAAAIIASIQPTIDEINQKLAEGVSFSELIEQYGNDPGMTVEPQKTNGYNVHIESIVWDPAFTKGAFTMEKVGDVSEPVISSFGVHIMEYTRDVPAGASELTDEVRTNLTAELIANAESDLFNAKMEAWMNECEIEYTAAAADYMPADAE